jgi:Ca2+/Na+ antiporter
MVDRNVASHFPNALSSLIVRSYHTSSPGEISRKWKQSGTSLIQTLFFNQTSSTKRIRRFTMTALVFSLLQYLGSMSPSIQRLILHLIQPLVLGALFYFGMVLQNHPLSLIGVGALLIAVILYVIYSLRKDEMEKEEADKFVSVAPSLNPSTTARKSNPSPVAIGRVSSKKVLFAPPSPTSQAQRQGGHQEDDGKEDGKEEEEIQWSDEISERNRKSSLSGDFSSAGVWSTHSGDGRSRGYSMDSLRSSDSDYTSFYIRNLPSLESADENSNESLDENSESNESSEEEMIIRVVEEAY